MDGPKDNLKMAQHRPQFVASHLLKNTDDYGTKRTNYPCRSPPVRYFLSAQLGVGGVNLVFK